MNVSQSSKVHPVYQNKFFSTRGNPKLKNKSVHMVHSAAKPQSRGLGSMPPGTLPQPGRSELHLGSSV